MEKGLKESFAHKNGEKLGKAETAKEEGPYSFLNNTDIVN